jgi:hypothetical protein
MDDLDQFVGRESLTTVNRGGGVDEMLADVVPDPITARPVASTCPRICASRSSSVFFPFPTCAMPAPFRT